MILAQDESIKHTTLAYIDDIYVDESLVLPKQVWKHFTNFGPLCKDSEMLKDGAKVLVLYIWVGGA